MYVSANILQQSYCQQVDIRMHSHGLRQLVDDTSVASCQQTFWKFIVKTFYPQAWRNKLDDRLIVLYVDETDKFVGTLDKLQQAGKIRNLQQVCDVFECACMQGRHWSVN